MAIKVRHNVIRSIEGKVKYKIFQKGGREHFHLGVWIDGTERELDTIEKVEYKLHPSFRRQVRCSENRGNNFSVTFWTWGMFNIEVSIYHSNGKITNINHYLKYELPSNENDYVQIN